MATKHKHHRATVGDSFSFIGVGLHTGNIARLSLKTDTDQGGIYFVRTDASPGQGFIDASWYNAFDTTVSTNLSNQFGISVNSVEQLMSALIACGIDNVRIEVNGPEIPILDSSADWVLALKYMLK